MPGEAPPANVRAMLAQASDCDDLLTKIQDDAIAKVKLSAQFARENHASAGGPGGVRDAGAARPSLPLPSLPVDEDLSESPTAPPNTGVGAGAGDDGTSGDPGEFGGSGNAGGAPTVRPDDASETNAQVAGVEEADFVKAVQNGAGMFLLHGNQLRKLKTFPAAESALTGTPLTIEGTPSEMFVSDAGKAVVFSSTYVPDASAGGSGGADVPSCAPGVKCDPYGGYYGGTNALKITIADVMADPPRVVRELYYEGGYVSSRRYQDGGDRVRVVVQGGTPYQALYQPNVTYYDQWGKPYAQEEIDSQIDEWEQRTSTSIRGTQLSDWLPTAWESEGGVRSEQSRACESYFVPVSGVSEYGLTQVLTLDLAAPASPVTGATVVGATSTVYSSGAQLVLAQPDYRWGGFNFNVVDQQRTALHVFELAGANTSYRASGWVPGQLPPHNPQFGIDTAADGTVRLATTGWVRDEGAEDFRSHPETHVITAQITDKTLHVVAQTENLGLPGETIQSARFVGNRAYVVTFLQTDPLVVVDVSDAAAPKKLGEIKIPGFSQYMHPLDEGHLITVGQNEQRGIQLQLFDVTNPTVAIPPPKVLDFGSSTQSAVSYDHKAFTFYDGVLAMPLTSYGYYQYGSSFRSELLLARVDASAGFTMLGRIDHSPLYADNGVAQGCGRCDPTGCYDYVCSYQPEMRRGTFVKSGEQTYVYSFSYAGMLVNELSNLTMPVATVPFPAPQYGGVGAVDAGSPPPVVRDGGVRTPSDASMGAVLDAGSVLVEPLPEPVPGAAVDAGVGG